VRGVVADAVAVCRAARPDDVAARTTAIAAMTV
jgi:hypothetical protein